MKNKNTSISAVSYTHLLCDGPQSLTPEGFDHMMQKVMKTRDFFQNL